MPQKDAPALLSERSYDAVVVGTGLAEAILAAALALSGSSVLHLDSNPFYGAGRCVAHSLHNSLSTEFAKRIL